MMMEKTATTIKQRIIILIYLIAKKRLCGELNELVIHLYIFSLLMLGLFFLPFDDFSKLFYM